MVELLWVMPGKTDGRVALSETHPDHPGGAAWVANTGQPVQVALTLAVERKLDSGDLVLCAAPKAAEEEKRPKTKAEVDAMIASSGGRPIKAAGGTVEDKPEPQAGYLWTGQAAPEPPQDAPSSFAAPKPQPKPKTARKKTTGKTPGKDKEA